MKKPPCKPGKTRSGKNGRCVVNCTRSLITKRCIKKRKSHTRTTSVVQRPTTVAIMRKTQHIRTQIRTFMKLNNVEFEQKDVDEIVHLAITHNMTQDQIHAGLIRAARK